MAIIKNRNTPGGNEFWDHVEQVAAQADKLAPTPAPSGIENHGTPRTPNYVAPTLACQFGCTEFQQDQSCTIHAAPPAEPAPETLTGWHMKPCPKEFTAIMTAPADWIVSNGDMALYFSNDEFEQMAKGKLQLIPLELLPKAAFPSGAPTKKPFE